MRKNNRGQRDIGIKRKTSDMMIFAVMYHFITFITHRNAARKKCVYVLLKHSYVICGDIELKKRLCATDLCLVFNLHILNFRVQIVFLLLIHANNYGLHIISIRSSAVPDVSEQSIKNWMTQRSEGNTWIKKKNLNLSLLLFLSLSKKIIPCVGIFVCFSFFFLDRERRVWGLKESETGRLKLGWAAKQTKKTIKRKERMKEWKKLP